MMKIDAHLIGIRRDDVFDVITIVERVDALGVRSLLEGVNDVGGCQRRSV